MSQVMGSGLQDLLVSHVEHTAGRFSVPSAPPVTSNHGNDIQLDYLTYASQQVHGQPMRDTPVKLLDF